MIGALIFSSGEPTALVVTLRSLAPEAFGGLVVGATVVCAAGAGEAAEVAEAAGADLARDLGEALAAPRRPRLLLAIDAGLAAPEGFCREGAALAPVLEARSLILASGRTAFGPRGLVQRLAGYLTRDQAVIFPRALAEATLPRLWGVAHGRRVRLSARRGERPGLL
jgi:hypothetical protein